METGDTGWRQLFTREHAVNLTLVCMGVWLHAADSLVVSTLMPSIVTDIGGVEYIAWTFALYEVGSIIAGAGGAYFVYQAGLRISMASAAFIYLAGCVFSALAQQMEVMLVGRLVQGLGGGGLVALSFIAMRRLFPARFLPLVVAMISALWGTSAFFGPLIGGIFAEFEFWRGAFWFFAIQAAGLTLWIMLILEARKQKPAGEKVNFPGTRLISLGLGVTSIASAGIDVSLIRSSVFVFIGLSFLAIFARLDARAGENRLFPRNPFDPRRGLGSPLMMVMCFAIATIAVSTFGPLILITIYDISALHAGYIIALSSIGWSIPAIAIAFANLPERLDGVVIMSGMIVLLVSIVGFMMFVSSGPFWLIPIFAILEGTGFGIAWTFLMRKAESISVPGDRDRMAGALPTIHRLGYAIGAAAIGIVANSAGFSEGVSLEAAKSAGFWVFAAGIPFAIIGLFAAWRFVRQRPYDPAFNV
ncbi:MAG: MFS transporter [Hyphomicrobiales bacterium]|nr:MFS transporter [Hyphomicrobiales bacterium]